MQSHGQHSQPGSRHPERADQPSSAITPTRPTRCHTTLWYQQSFASNAPNTSSSHGATFESATVKSATVKSAAHEVGFEDAHMLRRLRAQDL